jgi:hypothetical protein
LVSFTHAATVKERPVSSTGPLVTSPSPVPSKMADPPRSVDHVNVIDSVERAASRREVAGSNFPLAGVRCGS